MVLKLSGNILPIHTLFQVTPNSSVRDPEAKATRLQALFMEVPNHLPYHKHVCLY